MTFGQRLDELINRYWILHKGDFYEVPEKGPREEHIRFDAESEWMITGGPQERRFVKWRMQAEWLLVQNLGPDHPYTMEFLANVKQADYRGLNAAIAVLDALQEDYKNGYVEILASSTTTL